MYFIYILGPAGSGKSYLTNALKDWLDQKGLDTITINLDPAVSWLPYTPDIDIRDYITVEEVMRRYNLGPNGALIAAIDLSIEYIEKLIEEVEEYKPNYVIVDTPGQMEVFAFRASGPMIMNSLKRSNKAVSLFLVESIQVVKPSIFLSILILSMGALFAHRLPQILVVTKSDLMSKQSLVKIQHWIEEPLSILEEVRRENSMMIHLYLDIMSSLEDLIPKFVQDVVLTSSVTGEGIDDLYAVIQRILAGGEDFYTEEYSEVL
jgi:GTPase SAR1 family protein